MCKQTVNTTTQQLLCSCCVWYIAFYVYSCLQMHMQVSQNHSPQEQLPNTMYLPLEKIFPLEKYPLYSIWVLHFEYSMQ